MCELTPVQELYLEAFDEFLAAASPRARAHLGIDPGGSVADARLQMAIRANYVVAEARLRLPQDTRWTDSLFERAPSRRRP